MKPRILSIEDEETVFREIDCKIERVNLPSKLRRLNSYYWSWKLPSRPNDPRLSKLVMKIGVIREQALTQSAAKGFRNEQVDKPFSTEGLEELFSLTNLPPNDLSILEHCKMHYFILRYIREELYRTGNIQRLEKVNDTCEPHWEVEAKSQEVSKPSAIRSRKVDTKKESPDSSWCLIAKIREKTPFGEESQETKVGSKHFRPGAKVFIVNWYQGILSVVTVVGHHRKSNRLITIDMPIKYLTDLKSKVVYKPYVLERIAWGIQTEDQAEEIKRGLERCIHEEIQHAEQQRKWRTEGDA